MKKTLVCVAFLAFLLAGCASKTAETSTVPSESVPSGETTTTTVQGPLTDNTFDNPQFGDKEPVKTDDPTLSTAPEQDVTVNTTEGGQEGNGSTTGGNTGTTAGTSTPGTLTYEQFLNMTPEQQQAYQESYGLDEAGLSAFFQWYSAAKEQYEKEHPPEDIPTDGGIVLG